MESQKPDELLRLGLTLASFAGVLVLSDADQLGPMSVLLLATVCLSVSTVRAIKRR